MRTEEIFLHQSRNKTYGYIIKLYRQMLNNFPNEHSAPFHFLVWGYFDHMKIEPISSLKEFYLEQYDRSTHSNHLNFESQRMLLYSEDPNSERFISPLFKKNDINLPLIVISEIKISPPNLDGNPQITPYLKFCREEIVQFLHENIDSIPDLDFHAFSSLGYSDMVIVFRGQSYIKIMQELRKTRFNPQYPSDHESACQPIVNSTYSITGVDANQLDYVDQTPLDISIRISIKSLTGLEDVKKSLSKQHETIHPVFNSVFGKYDLDVICKDVNPRTFIMLCGTDHEFILNPESSEYRAHINYTNTRWIIAEEEIKKIHEPKLPQNNNDDNLKKIEWICKFILEHASLPESLNVTLQRLLICYVQIMRNEVSEKNLADELHEIFLEFLRLALCDMGIEEKDQNAILEGQNLQPDPHIDEEFDIESFEKGIQTIFNLIQDRVHASRMVFEITSYTPSVLNTSSDISKMYSLLVNKIEKILSNQTCKINYFTLFDHSNLLEAIAFFPKSVEKAGISLNSIHLNNTAFYDFAHSIPFLFHEIGHAIPPANISAFNTAFTKSMCKNIGYQFMAELLDLKSYSTIFDRFGCTAKLIINDIGKMIGEIIYKQIINIIHEDDKQKPLKIFFETFMDIFLNQYSYNKRKFNEKKNMYISEIFDAYPDMERDDIHIQNILELFEARIDILDQPLEKQPSLKLYWEKDFPYIIAHKEYPIKFVKTLEYKWNLLNNEIENQSKLINKNITNIFYDKSIMRRIGNIVRTIHSTESSEKDILIEYLSNHHLLEQRNSNQDVITKKIHQFLSEKSTKDALIKCAKNYVVFFNDILSDLNMINALKLEQDTYNRVLDKFEHNQKYQPILNGYQEDKIIRRMIISKVKGFQNESREEENIEVQVTVYYLSPLSDYLIRYEDSSILASPLNKPIIESIQKVYKENFHWVSTNNEQEPTLSNEINFIESILRLN